MAPDYWRTYFKPAVARRSSSCAHAHGLPVIYHGCGNVQRASSRTSSRSAWTRYNPLEAKAGLDVVDLRRRYGHRLAFCGNSDIRVWETRRPEPNPPRGAAQAQRRQGRRLHLPVRPLRLQLIVKLVRQYGQYPIDLGEFDEPV